MKTYFYTTGQFAKLCETTKETLRHYDNIGVIKPVKKQDNGYKYYSSHQIFDWYIISVLKHAGCSLHEIGDYLNESKSQTKSEDIRVILEKQLAAVNLQKKLLEQREEVLKESVDRFNILEQHSINSIYIEQEDDVYFITTLIKDSGSNESIVEACSEHMQYCKDQGLNIPYQYSYIMDYSKEGNIDCVASKIRPEYIGEITKGRIHKRHQGSYLKYIYSDKYYDMSEVHGKLSHYANCNNIQLDKIYYESEISIYREGIGDYITEISVRIKD